MIDKKLNIPQVSGIDTLYYFAKSGGYYKEFYMDILAQINYKKQEFESLDFAYQDSDIIIKVNDIDIKYSGKARDGFLWFNHNFFRIGFKDSEKNKNINDICVQLNASGIYTLGLSSLIEYVNKVFLDGAVLEDNHFPITRIDVNMFIQHSFKYLTKEMIVSKKKNHEKNLGERSSGYELETYYVGKKPFKLRIYNKMQELKNANNTKCELMYNHFGINGLDIKEPIWNVEFEMHREFLKHYGIDTIEDALERSSTLFKMACELVRLIDIDSISDKQINSKNRIINSKTEIWGTITNNYDNSDFMQVTTPMKRVERITYRYGLEDAKKSIKKVVKRLQIHSSSPTLFFFLEILQEAKEEFALQQEIEDMSDEYTSTQSQKDKEDLSGYSDDGLLKYEESLALALRNEKLDGEDYDEISSLYNNVFEELIKRGLEEPIPF